MAKDKKRKPPKKWVEPGRHRLDGQAPFPPYDATAGSKEKSQPK